MIKKAKEATLESLLIEARLKFEEEIISHKLYLEQLIVEYHNKIKEIDNIKEKNNQLETKINTIIEILGRRIK